jgi:hypothetical protein
MLQHRGFPRRQRPTEPSARSRSRLRERPVGASESAPEADAHPAPRADPPGASGQRDMPARVRPDVRVRVQGDCRRERAPRCGARQRRRHQALERESPQGAQPTGIPAGVEGTCILARNGRGRCGERPHARNGRSRATRRSRERSERDAGELAHRKAAAASGAGRHGHSCPAGRVARPIIHRPGGLRTGEAASVTGRLRLPSSRHDAP